ncbi:hypothetical protein JMK10_01200 [Rhodovulum sulfidophilum]|uniref:hypothetical protein n=3 Tax=Rhodovulum sulfidophilum TaxID=35806 RepID=UPI00192109D4|nr:hypothetical protein [Rhodovulum sulfidophilum]MBL3574717.1 hypothetical protein [Rhodovulum sulfidophilum]MCF4115473.1 hypothetical protein [Rhodovulum sulfidophilum]
MTEIDPLTAMRAKLKHRQEAHDRPGSGDIGGQLDALMAESSETIPPRDMTLGDGNGQETRRLVARPHLLRVGRARPAARATVPLPPDMQDDRAAPLIAAFQNRVPRFVAAAADLSITAARPACRVVPTEPGCPSMRCARSPAMKGPLLKAPPNTDRTAGAAPEGDDPVGACLARAAAGLRLCDGCIVEAVGDPDLTHRLTGFITLGLDAQASTAAGPKDRLRDPARASARRSAAGPGHPRHRDRAAAGARLRTGRNRRSLPPRRPA